MCHPANNQCRGWLSWSHDIAHLKRRCWAAIQTASVAAAGSVLVALLAALLLLPHSGAPLFTPSILAAFVAPRLSWLRISSLHIGNTGGHKNAASPQLRVCSDGCFGWWFLGSCRPIHSAAEALHCRAHAPYSLLPASGLAAVAAKKRQWLFGALSPHSLLLTKTFAELVTQ